MALTDAEGLECPVALSETPVDQVVLSRQLGWIIRLRWLAAVGVLVAITTVHFALKIHLAVEELYAGAFVLLTSNALFLFYNTRLERRMVEGADVAGRMHVFANAQIAVDFFVLIYLVHFSGGIENPFIFYFVFHMAISGIILTRREAYVQAVLASLLMLTTVAGEYLGLFPHYPLAGFTSDGAEPYRSLPFVTGTAFVFLSTIFLTIFFTTAIMDRLHEKERQLLELNRQLQEADRVKSRYVLTVSHDIKGPLSAIDSCLRVVLGNLAGEISAKAREMIERAVRRTEKLIDFVTYLLDLSRLKAVERVEKEEIPVAPIITRVLEQSRCAAEEKQIALTAKLNGNGLIEANQGLMEQLFSNLVQNGIKYTPTGGAVEVELTEEERFIRCCVRDTGIGIAEDDIPHIFDDFYRTRSACEFTSDGTGLGLSIVAQIVKVHGGEVQVKSAPGKGSEFHFRLCRQSNHR